MSSNDDIARQHFEHFHPEYAPLTRGEFEQQMNALGLIIKDLRLRVADLEKELRCARKTSTS